MQSNTLERSFRIAAQNRLLSREVFTFSVISRITYCVPIPLRNPHCYQKIFSQNKNKFVHIDLFYSLFKLRKDIYEQIWFFCSFVFFIKWSNFGFYENVYVNTFNDIFSKTFSNMFSKINSQISSEVTTGGVL